MNAIVRSAMLAGGDGKRALTSCRSRIGKTLSDMSAVPRLWYVSDTHLLPGAFVPPGRFGQAAIASGTSGPFYFFREKLFEYVRVTRTRVRVSRLNCAFAFESRELATTISRTTGEPCYEVVPADPQAPTGRHDMAWVDLAGEAGTRPRDVIGAIESYWSGRVAPTTSVGAWEWLSSSGLQVVGPA
jgi:hypothetical protein